MGSKLKDIVIVGSGGCAAELTFYIEDWNTKLPPEDRLNILGYIEYQNNIEQYWKHYHLSYPVLCDIDEYKPKPNQEVLVAIMNIEVRKGMIDKLIKKNAFIGSFTHHTAIVSKKSKIGTGNILFPYCIVEPLARVGDFNLLTSTSYISHDCIIGNNNFFSAAGIAGHVKVGNNNYFGIKSTVIPRITIGDNNKIQAGMVVDKNINNNSTIFYRYKEQVLAIPKK